MESEGDGDGAEDRQRQERKEGRSYHDNYRHNPSFGSIILEDLYTSSGRIIILPIGGYLHVLTFLSGLYSLFWHRAIALSHLGEPGIQGMVWDNEAGSAAFNAARAECVLSTASFASLR